MKADQYHSLPALSSSFIKNMLCKSPLHAWLGSSFNPNQPIQEPTAAMLYGSAAHSLILENVDLLAIIEADDFRTQAAKDARDEALSIGRIPMLAHKKDSFYSMCNMARMQIEDFLGFALTSGVAEHTITWTNEEIPCKARLDWVSGDRKLILDLKITELSSPAAFLRRIAASGYDIQESWYINSANADRFIFCVLETTEYPYPVYFVELDSAFQAIGAAKVKRAMQMFKACYESNTWPCYSKEIMLAEPPAWIISEAEEIDAQTHSFDPAAFLFGKVRR